MRDKDKALTKVLSLKKCPVCGKNFIPAPEHAYKTEGSYGVLVCTYSCMRNAEKAKKGARRRE